MILTQTLELAWKGLYPDSLTIPTAVKVAGIIPWIHHSQLKKAAEDEDRRTATGISDPFNIRLTWDH